MLRADLDIDDCANSQIADRVNCVGERPPAVSIDIVTHPEIEVGTVTLRSAEDRNLPKWA
jgi:hypothetical protein